MILSDKCWMKPTCKKYVSTDCMCRNDTIFCIKEFKMDYLYTSSLLTLEQRNHMNLRLDNDGCDREAFNKLVNYQNNIEENILKGMNIYIYSTITGNGKTAWATRLMQCFFNSIWYKTDLRCRGLFINVPRYLIAIKDNISNNNEYAEHIKNNVYDADLVIWDDIGTKAATSFEHENLLSIIDTRILSGKANIFTSNISCEALKELVGDRLYSRIINTSDIIAFYGKDKRGGII